MKKTKFLPGLFLTLFSLCVLNSQANQVENEPKESKTIKKDSIYVTYKALLSMENAAFKLFNPRKKRDALEHFYRVYKDYAQAKSVDAAEIFITNYTKEYIRLANPKRLTKNNH